MNKAFLAALEEEISRLDIGQNPSELYDPIHYLLSLGGKRIRPVLCLLTYSLFKSDWEKQVPAALSVEIFHNFTLMHDDIMDKAPIRRGKQTVHEKWNDNIAILSGDVMLVNAYQYLNKVKGLSLEAFQHLLGRLSRIAAEVCEGQQFDMNFEAYDSVHEDEYLNRIRLKTAVLLGFSLQLGAILAGAEKEDSEKLYRFGVDIGVGFQLKDDLLDVFADQAKFGKQVGGDIISNKKTFLLIKANELAEGDAKMKLEYWLEAKTFNKEEKVAAVTAIYDSLGIKSLTEAKMKAYFDKGFEQYAALEVPNKKIYISLLQLTQDLVHREK